MLPRNWTSYQNAECLSTRNTLRRKYIASIYRCQLAYLLHLGTTGTWVCLSSWRRNNGDKLEVHVTIEWNETQITALNLSVRVAVTWLRRWSPSPSEKDCARSPSNPSEICSPQSGNGTDILLPGFQFSLVSITPSVLRAFQPSTINTCLKQMILLLNKRFSVPLSFP
jgi:hypothetical protein